MTPYPWRLLVLSREPPQICGSIRNSSLQRSFICIFLKREAAHFGWVIFPEKSAQRFLISPVTSHFEAPSRFSFPSKTFVIVSFWDCHEIMGVVVLIPIHLKKNRSFLSFPQSYHPPCQKKHQIFLFYCFRFCSQKIWLELKKWSACIYRKYPKMEVGATFIFLNQHFKKVSCSTLQPMSELRKISSFSKGSSWAKKINASGERRVPWLREFWRTINGKIGGLTRNIGWDNGHVLLLFHLAFEHLKHERFSQKWTIYDIFPYV